MKERPILFSAPMVRAMIEDRKIQTRRVAVLNACGRVKLGKRQWHIDDPNAVLACPYGQSGDHLWVRESFAVQPQLWEKGHGQQPVHYLADISNRNQIEDYVAKPSIHMPRWASRITLEITEVRVQRVQEISSDDCFAEGIEQTAPEIPKDPQIDFATLWDSINAKRGYGWDKNPFCWVLTFRRIGP